MPLSAYCFGGIMSMWNVKQTEEFQEWFDKADRPLKEAVVENVEVLKQLGPQLGRPRPIPLKVVRSKISKS